MLTPTATHDLPIPEPSSSFERVRKRLGEKLEAYDRGDDQELSIRHDPAKDTLPKQPMYHPAFTRAEKSCLEIIRRFLGEVSTINGTELAACLLPKLHEASSMYTGKAELVGFFGETGQGKSTAVGVLLGDDNLIKEVCIQSFGMIVLKLTYARRPMVTASPVYLLSTPIVVIF